MESNLVNEDSIQGGIGSQVAINLIKLFFIDCFPDWKVNREYDKAGFWGIYYEKDKTLIKIDSDRGGLECSVVIDGKVSPLWQFDKKVIDATTANEKKIKIVLTVLKVFFDEQC